MKGEMEFLNWDFARWVGWIFVIAPLTAYLAFHSLAVAGALGRVIVSPQSAGTEVGGIVGSAARALPGGYGVARLFGASVSALAPEVSRGVEHGAAPRVVREEHRLPVGMARGEAGGYTLTLSSDRTAYAPGDMAAVTVELRNTGTVPAPLVSGDQSASVFGPGAAPEQYGMRLASMVTRCAGRLAQAVTWCLPPGGAQRAVVYPVLASPGTYVLSARIASVAVSLRLPVSVSPAPRGRTAAAAAAAAAWRAAVDATTFEPATVTVSAPAAVSSGQPVPIRLTVRNDGGQPLDPGYALYGFGVRVLDAAGRVVAATGCCGGDVAQQSQAAGLVGGGGVLMGKWSVAGGEVPCGIGNADVCAARGATMAVRAWWVAHANAPGQPPMPPGRYVIEAVMSGSPIARLPIDIR